MFVLRETHLPLVFILLDFELGESMSVSALPSTGNFKAEIVGHKLSLQQGWSHISCSRSSETFLCMRSDLLLQVINIPPAAVSFPRIGGVRAALMARLATPPRAPRRPSLPRHMSRKTLT